jgi:hypothetical protein
MRGFAAGIWVTAIVMAYFLYTNHETAQTEAKPAEITKDQVEQYLNEHGQMAVNKSEYSDLQAKAGKGDSDKKDTSSGKENGSSSDEGTNKKDDNGKSQPAVHSYTLHIQSGMTGGKIGMLLEDANIIEDRFKLIHYLEDHHIEQDVQLGTFKLKSDMSIAEIAKKITS